MSSPSSSSSPSNPSTVHSVRVSQHTTPTLGTHRRHTHYTKDTTPPTDVAHQYVSIRFAQPLTPSDRWRRARPLPGIALPLPFHKTPVCPQPRLKGLKSLVSEDCLYSEIWVPADVKDQESERRPVLIYLHGGFLQWGSVYQVNPAELVRRTGAIVVMPAYRLNAFGYLSCEGMYEDGGFAGNFGFWDQRLAIEWVVRNIHAWGGDASRITLGGYSAGSYSVFHQLMYESRLSDDEAVIKQVVMFSNGCGLQPKSLGETKEYFEHFANALGIPDGLSEKEKLDRMRAIDIDKLTEAVDKTHINAFRAVTDGAWVKKTFLQDIVTGNLGKVLARRKVRILIGENKNENVYYANFSPPKDYNGLVKRLSVEFPAVNSNRLAALYAPRGQLPQQYKDWKQLFGEVYSDCQIHLTGRGFLAGIQNHVDAANIFRYRIYKRIKASDTYTPPEMGATHTSDWFIWFIGSGKQIQDSERPTVDAWVAPVKDYLEGAHVNWGCNGVENVRIIQEKGWAISTETDPLWKHYMFIWKRLLGARSSKL